MNKPGYSLIMCYDPQEIVALRELLGNIDEKPVQGSLFPLVFGSIHGSKVGLIRIPFGDRTDLLTKVLRSIFTEYAPDEAFSIGTAMSLDRNLAIGDLAITVTVRCGQVIGRFSRSLNSEMLNSSVHGQKPRLITSFTTNKFLSSEDEIEMLRNTYPESDTVEMEDFYVAQTAKEFEVPCCSLRAVSDFGDFQAHKAKIPELAKKLALTLNRFFRRRKIERMLEERENNPCRDIPFRIFLFSQFTEMDLPEAVDLTRRIVKKTRLSQLLREDARVDLLLVRGEFDRVNIPKGFGKGFLLDWQANWGAWINSERSYFGLWLRTDEAPQLLELPDFSNIPGKGPEIDFVKCTAEFRFAALKPWKKVHIQGLNSISAEAEEGLLAAGTIEEFHQEGYQISSASQGELWIYRTAHASEESYFEPDYSTPFRDVKNNTELCYRVVSGLGPSIEPSASGGKSADLLILGDEQGGRLINYLEDMSSSEFGLEDVFRYSGVAARLSPNSFVISRLDRRWILSEEGLNSLSLDPGSLRMVYSREYDGFLRDYFSSTRRPNPAKESFLLLTSRGCGNECSICCSGGFMPFLSLKASRVIDILEAILEKVPLDENEYIEIFFLDSNFNKIPGRIIELAAAITASGLRNKFEFFVRHNGIQGFLQGNDSRPVSRPANEALIKAYRELGIDEIVIGIDSFTDTSIRILKTNFQLLRRDRELVAPGYSFAEIENVLLAIERERLKSRGFFLMHNPFVGERDRVRTFYNLFRLAWLCPNFIIDHFSSNRVNELKPFPGAPLTQIAKRFPNFIQGNRFSPIEFLNGVESMLRFDVFHRRRETSADFNIFLSSVQQIRHGLGEFFMGKIGNKIFSIRNEMLVAAFGYLEDEEEFSELVKRDEISSPLLRQNEVEILGIRKKLKEKLDSLNLEFPSEAYSEKTLRFFNALEDLE